MKPNANLNTVLEVSRQRRDEALQALGAVQRERQQADQQMAQLQGYTQESLQRWQDRARQGVTPQLLQAHQGFMAKLDEAVRFQQAVLQRIEQQLTQAQQRVLQAERDLASLNKYAERRETAWQKTLQRQEQKSNDEMAANIHRQQHASERSRP